MEKSKSKKKRKDKNHTFLSFTVWFIILMVLGFLGRDYVTKVTAEFMIESSLGVPVSINSIDLNVFKNYFTIKRLIIYNPPGFSGTLAEVPYVYVSYDRDSFIKRKPYIKELEISMFEVSVIKNHNYEINLNRLKAIIDRKKIEDAATNRVRTKINTLVLSTDHVYLVDYTKGKPLNAPIKMVINRKKYTTLNYLNDIILFLINRMNKIPY